MRDVLCLILQELFFTQRLLTTLCPAIHLEFLSCHPQGTLDRRALLPLPRTSILLLRRWGEMNSMTTHCLSRLIHTSAGNFQAADEFSVVVVVAEGSQFRFLCACVCVQALSNETRLSQHLFSAETFSCL